MLILVASFLLNMRKRLAAKGSQVRNIGAIILPRAQKIKPSLVWYYAVLKYPGGRKVYRMDNCLYQFIPNL
jgi:hypothetical protein